MRKINVGISIAPTERANIWSNGIDQHIAFLATLLGKVAGVEKVYLINAGPVDHLPPSMGMDIPDVPLVRPHDVTHELDLVIEFGASLPLEWLRHVRALGTRIVTFFVGHTYTGQAEPPIFARPGSAAFIGTPWHEIWTLASHMKSSGPMLRTVGRVPVMEMPHIWSPLFLDRHVRALEQAGQRFGFQPAPAGQPRPGWRVAIVEPNISVGKSCFIPMLACEHAYRQRREAVDRMMVMNTFFMKEHSTFNRFASHLDLTRDGKASYEPRLAFAECIAGQKIDAVVAHHWEWGLNYAYYDALHGGYPLVHNSEYLQAADMGFYYPGFEATAGGQALLDAWAREPGYWEGYRRRSADYLRTLSPDHPGNIQAFANRIASVLGDKP